MGERSAAPRRALLHDPPRVEHDGALAQLAHDPEVVGDEQERHVPIAHQRAQELEDLRLDRHVESRGGLVSDEQLWLARRAPSRS